MTRTNSRRGRRLAAAAMAGALTLAGATTAATTTATAADRGAPACSLDGATVQATRAAPAPLGDTFTAYADSGVGWTGADSTYSVPLRDGSLAWIFSDTFLGPVAPDGSRPQSTPFLNNSIVLQDGAALRTVTGGTADAPESIVGPDPDGAWHWFGAGLATRRGDLQVGVLEFARFGEGTWDWGWSGSSVATLDTDTWQVTSVDPLPSGAGIQWASWYQRSGGHVLVYGVEDRGGEKFMHVAKVLGGDLADTGRWRYWDGSAWVRDEAASARVMAGVANEYSVTPYRDGWLLVTQDTSVPFSDEIKAFVSCSPTGPFTGGATIHRMPEVGAAGSYGDPDVIAYNAHEHPELRDDDTLLVTYNVNSVDPDDLYADVSIYRPRFVEITLDVRH
ncbi:DUF4185 domain-containing protein [Isoptericola sp. NPDC057559]|uniref:DUF4185 domain-containing protein n=1 Tax=Isoptericola sp. NPDC057559 TaxID=3346168 RepID=UPI0036C407BA